jgi:Ran GTPase-activating protein (RanGAP) involved in mRNA processing and transport
VVEKQEFLVTHSTVVKYSRATMASREAAVVRDLVRRLTAHPQAERSLDNRGHIRASSLDADDLRDVVQTKTDEMNLVEALAELQVLKLPSSQLGDKGLTVLLRAFKEGSRRGSTLRILDVADNGITVTGLGALTDALGANFLPNLEDLIVSQNTIGEEGANMIAKVLRTGHLPSLRGLDVSYCQVGTQGLVSLADAFRSGKFAALGIQSLDLAANGIEERAVKMLTTAMDLRRLAELSFFNLSGNDLGAEGIPALANVIRNGHLRKITHLRLSHCCSIVDGLVPIFQALEWLPNLQVLELNGNSIGLRGSVALAKALRTGEVSNLRDLNLSQCGIGGQQVDLIMEAFPTGQVWGLQRLDMSYNNLSSNSPASLYPNRGGIGAVMRLIRSGRLRRLEYLNLSHCSITDIGLIDLAICMKEGKLPHLQRFLFDGNEIRSKKSIKALVSALESGHLAGLEELELGQNSVGEDATMALASALTISLARGPVVETLTSRLAESQKAFEAGRPVGEEVKKIFRNRSFKSLGVIKVNEGELPASDRIYNRFLERQYSNRVAPVVEEEIAEQRPSNSKFFFNVMLVLVWLVAVLISKRF